MKELEKNELMGVDGGVVLIDDAVYIAIGVGLAIGVGAAVTSQILSDWDDFKEGFFSAFN